MVFGWYMDGMLANFKLAIVLIVITKIVIMSEQGLEG